VENSVAGMVEATAIRLPTWGSLLAAGSRFSDPAGPESVPAAHRGQEL